MNCTKAQDLFSGVLENSVSPSLGAEFRTHLAECSKCESTYVKFAAAMSMVEELPEVDVPVGLHSAIMARVEQARRAVPVKVRWWSVDWSKAFTVRVPARAAAMGFAMLLALTVLARLEMQHITQGALTPGGSTSPDYSLGIDEKAMRPWGPWGTGAYQSDSGLLISVAVQPSSKRNVYPLRLQNKGDQPLDFTVQLVSSSNWGSADSASGSSYSASSVAQGKDFVLPVVGPGDSHSAAAAKVTWSSEGRRYVEYAFLPGKFDPKAAARSLDVDFQNATTYSVLSGLSAKYGIVILASGNLGGAVSSFSLAGGTPADVFYELDVQMNLKYRQVASSVYAVDMPETPQAAN